MAETMRAGRMLGVGQMVCEDAPIPGIGPGQVLVHTEYASICGSDLHIVMQGAGLALPEVCPHGFPGHEGVGTVVASEDDSVAVGTRVLTFPNTYIAEGFSEYQRLTAGRYCLPLPDTDLPVTHLLMAQQLGTVLFAHRHRPNEMDGATVVVIGQGSAGLFWTWLLRRAGAGQIVTCDRSDARLAVSRAYGADLAVNVDEVDIRDVVADLTTGSGADYVVEAVGSSTAHDLSIELARVGGHLMWFGLPDTNASIEMNFQKFFRKKLSATSIYGAQDEADVVSFRTALDHIAGGDIDVAPLLSHVFSIEEIDRAMEVAFDPVEAGAVKVSVGFT